MSPSKAGMAPDAGEHIGQLLTELRAARSKLGWIISVHGNEGLNYALLEADSYLQQAVDALSRAGRSNVTS